MVETYVITEFYLPKLPALLSMMGSSLIVAEVYQDHATNTGRRLAAVSHILVSMSIGDFLFSLGWFLGTWVAPKEQPDNFLQGTNHGTHATCDFQGFIVQMGLMASLLFNASLAVVFLVMTRYQWCPERVLANNKLLLTSLFFWTISLATALIPLCLDMYRSVGPICWISAPADQACVDIDSAEAIACQKGRDATAVVLSLQLIPIWFCIILDSIIMVLIYRKARSLERETHQSIVERRHRLHHRQGQHGCTIHNPKGTISSIHGDKYCILDRTLRDPELEDADPISRSKLHDKHHTPSVTPSPVPPQEGSVGEDEQSTSTISPMAKPSALPTQLSNRSSQIVATQGMRYIAGFFLTYGLTTVSVLVYVISGDWNKHLDRASYFFLALQGLWNFLIFSCGRKEMKTRIGATWKHWILDAPWCYCCCCCSWSRQSSFKQKVFLPQRSPASATKASPPQHDHHNGHPVKNHEHCHRPLPSNSRVSQQHEQSSNGNKSAATNNKLAPIAEVKFAGHNLPVMTIDKGTCSNHTPTKTGNISNSSGFWIRVKEVLVSELGASRIFCESESDEYSSSSSDGGAAFDIERPLDKPSQPFRAGSGNDTANKSHPRKPHHFLSKIIGVYLDCIPPLKPIRTVSEVSTFKKKDERPTKPVRGVSLVDEDQGRDCAPSRPLRYESDVSTMELEECLANPIQHEITLTVENKGEAEFTHSVGQPKQLVSSLGACVDGGNPRTKGTQEKAPSRPIRLLSEIDSIDIESAIEEEGILSQTKRNITCGGTVPKYASSGP